MATPKTQKLQNTSRISCLGNASELMHLMNPTQPTDAAL